MLAVAACLLLPGIATAQGLMGALIGTVKDEQGGVCGCARQDQFAGTDWRS